MVGDSPASVVAILTRAPSAGGKSRLFAALRRPHDPALLSAMLLDTLDGASAPGATRVVAVEPAHACDEVRGLMPNEVRVVAQVEGSLGERMRGLMAQMFAAGASVVALVGSDLPDLRPEIVEHAFRIVHGDPASIVLGPSHDGGYYLIAAAGVPEIFEGVEWGTAKVLEQTCALAHERGVRVHLLESIADVDIPDDLRRVRGSRTAAWVREHGA